ncbi:MAG: argininosuccinate synthase [Chloroflexi bacterium]|nr:argininosuccinate synthase [Chloroflexota bacterium]
MAMKVVLAYSGGLDTSVAIPWLKERYDAEVITLTANLGGGQGRSDVEERALAAGAIKAFVVEGREDFVRHFVFPALQAGAIYQGQYSLGTALGRPLIARYLLEVAHREGAEAVAHGCTGKGNDQVRFDLSIAGMDPSLRIIAPAREWNMTRDEEIQYGKSRNVPLDLGQRSPFSIDENLWGRSIEAGTLEDPWQEPPEEAYSLTRSLENTPQTPLYMEVSFNRGLPVALNGDDMNGVDLIQHINDVAGEHGVGRVDHLEDRLVGIKSREVYEAPAATVLHAAHRALESITLSRDQLRLKEKVSQEYAEHVYNGLWYTGFHQDLDAYVKSTQHYVTGTIRVKLFKGSCTVVGRTSPFSLYQHDLATYDKGDSFDHRASEGFIHIYGLAGRTQARVQPLELPELN